MNKLKLFSFLFLYLIFNGSMYSQPDVMWVLYEDGTILRYAYSGGDEFNSSELNDNIWINSYGYGRNYSGTCSQEYMTDGLNYEFGYNPSVNSGTIKFIVKKEDIYARGIPYESDDYLLDDGLPNLRWWHYTSGMVKSKQRYKYGLFEIKCKLPEGKGLWPAFWLFGGNPNEEFDIFEYKGETPNKFHIDVHCPTNCNNFGEWLTATGNFTDSFNIFRGEWTPNWCTWSLNDDLIKYWFGNLDYQANLIASVGVANDEPCPFSPGPDESTVFPASYEIDFIRVWTRLECNNVVTICDYNQSLTDPTVITGSNIVIGGDNCFSNLTEGDYLRLTATEDVTLLPSFKALAGSNLSINIVECPGPSSSQPYSNNRNNGGNINVLDDDLDSLNNLSSTEQADGVNKITPQMYFYIYPNPSSGKLKIEIIGTISDKIDIDIEILNLFGRSIYKIDNIKSNFVNVDLSGVPNGIYILRGRINKKIVNETFKIHK